MWAPQRGGRGACPSVLPPHARGPSRPLQLHGPQCPPALPGRPPSCGAAPPPSAMLGLHLFICFCLNSDLFHVWFENFQTQKSKKLGRIWCPCPQPAMLWAGSSVHRVPPSPGPGPTRLLFGTGWRGGSKGDTARVCGKGGAGGPPWPGWAGAGPPYCAANLGARRAGGGHGPGCWAVCRRSPGAAGWRFWNACGRVQ